MNEEKNNIGVNNSGFPPMNTVSARSMSSQNMGVNNLPPMGSTPSASVQQTNNTVNIQDKYGLPPISNFTNFNTNYETPKVDSNTSVFDLMDQFESVNNNAVNNITPVQNSVPTNNVMNQTYNTPNTVSNNQGLNTNVMPSIPVINNTVEPINNIPVTPVNNINQTNNVDHTLDIFNGISNVNTNLNKNVSVDSNVQPNVIVPNTNIENVPSVPTNSINNASNPSTMPNTINNSFINNAPMSMFSGNRVETSANSIQENGLIVSNSVSNQVNNTPQVENTVSPTVVNPQEQLAAFNNVNTLPIENNNSVNTQNINNESEFVNTPTTLIKTDSGLFTSDQNNTQNIVVSNVDSLENPNNVPPMVNNAVDNVNFNGVSNGDNIVEIPTTSIENETDNSELNLGEVIGNTENNVDSASDNNGVEDLITSFDTNTNNNVVNDENNTNVSTTNNTVSNDGANVDKPKKKKKKLLFIILLIITIIIVSAVGVLSYFMFFKTDKLVCGLQDYSNNSYILDESVVFRFKGNKMVTANFNQVLTYDNDHLEEKEVKLEELKNQYQGLGLNVAFIENENGFEIDINFTKSELESWYGDNIKNSSKSKMKKEMRESGYTCK